ncbi:OmpH family outer membrane protein [Motiliproteus sp. SC1-56]|uniref:OmpH family outer membrane protein n=1 Tax=Motiliproteus sp. SC1-56 TaxID=2799565 RepID=UPI001A8FB7BC|nr:OmpH family outer membrane protein [Motiliproteus sp. SC1-56]
MKAIKNTVLALCLLPVAAWGETIAVLDIESAIRASKPADEFRQQLNEEFSTEQAQLRQLQEQGNALQEKAQKEADFLSEEERQRLMGDIQAKYQEFQQLSNRLKQRSQQREQAFLEQLRPQVEAILQKMVDDQDIDVILNKKALVYAKPDLDLTQAVVDKLNQQ